MNRKQVEVLLRHLGNDLSAGALNNHCQWLASGSYDGTIRYSGLSGASITGRPLAGHSSGVVCVAISEDDRLVVFGSLGETVRIWDVCSNRAMRNPPQHDELIMSFSLSQGNQRIVSVDRSYEVRM